MDNNLYQGKYKKESNRLKTHDYSSPAWYFLTLCSSNHTCLFGHISEGLMHHNSFGRIVEEEWKISPSIRKEIEEDEFTVMPNHFHALIGIDFKKYEKQVSHDNYFIDSYKPKSISTLISGFKSAVISKIRSLLNNSLFHVWQSNYYDHIVRKEESLERIRNYIRNNPYVWKNDRHFKE